MKIIILWCVVVFGLAGIVNACVGAIVQDADARRIQAENTLKGQQ
jgi:hypothetical protein